MRRDRCRKKRGKEERGVKRDVTRQKRKNEMRAEKNEMRPETGRKNATRNRAVGRDRAAPRTRQPAQAQRQNASPVNKALVGQVGHAVGDLRAAQNQLLQRQVLVGFQIGEQCAVAHELRQNHVGLPVHDDAKKAQDVRVVKLRHDGGLFEKLQAVALHAAHAEALDGAVPLWSEGEGVSEVRHFVRAGNERSRRVASGDRRRTASGVSMPRAEAR